MARVVWRPDALRDLDRISDYIEQFDLAAADRIVQRLIECGDGLAIFPNRGRPAVAGQREMTSVPPYVITYTVEDEIVLILGIRHGARRPEA